MCAYTYARTHTEYCICNKELAHLVMEAKKSCDVQAATGDPGEPMGWDGFSVSPKVPEPEEPMM